MRLDETGLFTMVETRHIPIWDRVYNAAMPVRSGYMWAGQEAPIPAAMEPRLPDAPPFNFAKAAGTAAGILIFMGLGLAASIVVFLVKGPLWGIGTAIALGSGYYLWQGYSEAEYRRMYGV